MKEDICPSTRPSSLNQESINFIAETVFANTRIYVEDLLKKLNPFFLDVEDSKLNIATLSSLLFKKNLFTEQEFQEIYREMKSSFGVVDSEGKMDGGIEVTFYNFSSSEDLGKQEEEKKKEEE